MPLQHLIHIQFTHWGELERAPHLVLRMAIFVVTGRLYCKYADLPISPQPKVILHKRVQIVAVIWMFKVCRKYRRLECQRELRRLRQSGESVIIGEGQLEIR